MTRPLSRALAPLVEDLELDAVVVVTTKELLSRARRVGIKVPSVGITRLAQQGWLLKTGVSGAWEFAPASHAGPISHGDVFLTLRAQLAVTPDLPARVALLSALWRHGITDRPPNHHEVSVPPRTHVPVALTRAFDVSRFQPELPAVTIDRLPVNGLATTLVHLVARPTAVASWGAVMEVLDELVAAADPDDVLREAHSRPAATRVRLAYLIEPVAPELVERLEVSPGPLVWFGPRRKLRRYSARWNVADTVLPPDNR